jgi:mediator of RNA polymerase II transcription subunit 14
VADGTVTFVVRHEFECRLALLGDGPTDPWTLLSLEMLVEDRETGQGKALMHSLQIGYVRGLVQSRLDSRDTVRPLHDLYAVLHGLAQLLQLEVLHSQTMRLCLERLRDYIRVEEYIPGRALTISYWRELSARDPHHADQGYRLSIQVDPHDPAKPLVVIHTPQLTAKEAETAEKSIRTDHLSVESLLVHSIYVRTRARLTELQAEVQRRFGLGDAGSTLHGSPAVLAIPILQPCLRSEQLLVSVDTHTGMFLAHVPQYPANPFSPQIQTCLNGDRVQLEAQVSELRYWITARRIEKTLQQLPATPFEQLPLTYDLKSHPLSRMGRHKMYVRLHRQPYAILVVDYSEKPGKECEIQYSYHYLLTR